MAIRNRCLPETTPEAPSSGPKKLPCNCRSTERASPAIPFRLRSLQIGSNSRFRSRSFNTIRIPQLSQCLSAVVVPTSHYCSPGLLQEPIPRVGDRQHTTPESVIRPQSLTFVSYTHQYDRDFESPQASFEILAVLS